jgi:TRAP-type C4-dicarboxylate transport system permease small subunit
MSSLTSIFTKTLKIAISVAALAIFFVMCLIVIDIIGRSFFNMPFPSTFEITEAGMAFIVFLAFGYTEATKQNIMVEMLTRHLPERWGSLANIPTCLAGMFLYGLIFWGSWKHALQAWQVREFMTGTIALPLYPAKFVVPLGSALLLVQFLVDLVKGIASLLGNRETGE